MEEFNDTPSRGDGGEGDGEGKEGGGGGAEEGGGAALQGFIVTFFQSARVYLYLLLVNKCSFSFLLLWCQSFMR